MKAVASENGTAELKDPGSHANFTRTHWSVVLLAAQDTPEGTEALEVLCRTYWRPVYAFIRRKGYASADAQDLTQEFLARLIQHRSLTSADPQKGRFRSFLLGALEHFLADERDKAHAAKRGGGQRLIPLEEAEETCAGQLASDLHPDKVFAQQWAWSLVDAALKQMAVEHAEKGRADQFAILRPFLTEEPRARAYAGLSQELGMSENAVAKAIQRLRERFRRLVRHTAAQTLADPADLEDELRQLFA